MCRGLTDRISEDEKPFDRELVAAFETGHTLVASDHQQLRSVRYWRRGPFAVPLRNPERRWGEKAGRPFAQSPAMIRSGDRGLIAARRCRAGRTASLARAIPRTAPLVRRSRPASPLPGGWPVSSPSADKRCVPPRGYCTAIASTSI
jgi:hypothetical protein